MSVVETKSILARLLAEENITVQHKNIPTAYFDTKQRILACPVFKDMSADLYDLLMGHEVGHALYTPPEGWHNALAGNRPGFKSFLNVVEDARIERLVKDKFPGIRPAFYRGYKELDARDFFGLKKVPDINLLALIDRINLHYKLGVMAGVTFSSEEQPFVDMVGECETWEDVVDVATILYDRAKKQENSEERGNDRSGSSEGAEQPQTNDYEDTDYENSDDSEEDDNSEDTEASGQDTDSDDDQEFDYGGSADTGAYDEELSDPVSQTDQSFREREQSLVDEKCIPTVYIDLPTYDLTDRIVGHKEVYANMHRNAFFEGEKANFPLKEFYSKNLRYINGLVQEFELRKNAKQFARASISKTGELDMTKISKYRFTDDMFKRVTQVPQGKNHGMLMFLDLSGSMRSNMEGTLEQVMVLSVFCRKVNIPFRVYGFSDSPKLWSIRGKITPDGVRIKNSLVKRTDTDVLYVEQELFHLREYLSSSMSRLEFTNALQDLEVLRNLYLRGHIPDSEALSGTPLNEAIIASNMIAQEFRAAYKLEVLTTMFLTDGSATGTDNMFVNSSKFGYLWTLVGGGHYGNYKVCLTDPKTRESVTYTHGDCLTRVLIDLSKKITKANMIGFFITDDSLASAVKNMTREYSGNKVLPSDKEIAAARKQKFFPLTGAGYDIYFIVPSKNLRITDHGMNVDSKASKNDIKKAFLESVRSAGVNRIFLSRFAEIVSKNH